MIVELNNKDYNGDNLGNKGKFLLQMKKNKFNVPGGIVLDSYFYDQFVSDNELENKIKSKIKNLNKDNTKDISKAICKLFNETSISSKLLDEVKSKLNPKKLYAVRSSGTKEDLDDYSFAGQYVTFLNVEFKDLEKSIIGCYESMFSDVILSYLVNNSISLDNLKMSVVVQ